MQKLIRITDNNLCDKEILTDFLRSGWKVVNMVTCASSQNHNTFFHSLILLEKKDYE